MTVLYVLALNYFVYEEQAFCPIF